MSAMLTAEQLYQSARTAMAQSQPKKSRQLLENALSLDQHHVNSWHLLADTYVAEGRVDSAIETLKKSLGLFSSDQESCLALEIHLASNFIKTGDLASAAHCIKLKPLQKISNWQLIARAGYIFAICEEHKSALEAFRAAMNLNSRDPELLFNAAAANRSMGNLEIAEELYNKVIASSKHSYQAYTLRSGIRKQTKEDNHINQLLELSNDSTISNEGRIHIYYALAKELEDLKQYQQSFEALKKGAALKKNFLKYDITPDLIAIQQTEKTYTAEAIRAKRRGGKLGEGIIFILGMPRTGSTLVDRIISSLDEVDSAGEPNTFAKLFYTKAFQQTSIKNIQKPNQLDAIKNSINIDFKELGKEYQDKLLERAAQKGSTYIIDKNPNNYLHIGAISLALPKAKIIHIVREPMDSCFAIYKTLFKNSHPYSYDLGDLGKYYCAYMKLMEHWRKSLPNKFYEINYEKLIQDPETESKNLIKYCGLEWNENCLNFHKNREKGTATASATQVRQPIYKSSIKNWKNYEAQLKDLENFLKENIQS